MSIIKESSKEVDIVPLDIAKKETISAILSSLDLIKESPYFVGVASLAMRKKPNKKKEILDLKEMLNLLNKLDDMDD
jgi:hypothetical protein